MTVITFRDDAGAPIADAVVTITGAPGEIADLGYVTDSRGTARLDLPTAGEYRFIVSNGGTPLVASAMLTPDVDSDVVAQQTA